MRLTSFETEPRITSYNVCYTKLLRLVEKVFQPGVRAAQLVDHLFRPVEVFPLSFQAPLCRRIIGQVAQVADFVRQFSYNFV